MAYFMFWTNIIFNNIFINFMCMVTLKRYNIFFFIN